jgi:hypothetical protein
MNARHDAMMRVLRRHPAGRGVTARGVNFALPAELRPAGTLPLLPSSLLSFRTAVKKDANR